MNSLVSIIMPLYNCETFVKKSINSVIQQSYQNWELLIVDDRSTDNAYRLSKDLIDSDMRIRLYQLDSNNGAAATRNYAIKLAEGRYIAFLDSDDLWTPDKLEQQIGFMQKNKSAFSFTGYQWISEDGIAVKDIAHVPARVDYRQLLKKNIIGCLTAIYDSSQIGKFYFDTSLDKHEDYQYWLEMLKSVPYAEGLDESLAYYRIRHNSLSSNKIDAAKYVWKILREYQNIPLPQALYYFGCFAAKSLLKYYGK